MSKEKQEIYLLDRETLVVVSPEGEMWQLKAGDYVGNTNKMPCTLEPMGKYKLPD